MDRSVLLIEVFVYLYKIEKKMKILLTGVAGVFVY